MMIITIADGRGALWQWDTGRRVKVDGDVEQVHYQNCCFGNTIDVDVGADGTAIIPDELLHDWHPITVYAYTTDDTGGYTEVQTVLPVHKRAKPADYVYTPTDQKTLADMQRQIGDLSELETEAKDNLVAAINEAATSANPATTESLGLIKVGANLKITKDGVLSVDTADAVEQDNTKPVTSAAVHTEIGNIEVLLAAI